MGAVLIKSIHTGEVVERIECKGDPGRVEMGVLINLDHENYYTETEE